MANHEEYKRRILIQQMEREGKSIREFIHSILQDMQDEISYMQSEVLHMSKFLHEGEFEKAQLAAMHADSACRCIPEYVEQIKLIDDGSITDEDMLVANDCVELANKIEPRLYSILYQLSK